MDFGELDISQSVGIISELCTYLRNWIRRGLLVFPSIILMLAGCYLGLENPQSSHKSMMQKVYRHGNTSTLPTYVLRSSMLKSCTLQTNKLDSAFPYSISNWLHTLTSPDRSWSIISYADSSRATDFVVFFMPMRIQRQFPIYNCIRRSNEEIQIGRHFVFFDATQTSKIKESSYDKDLGDLLETVMPSRCTEKFNIVGGGGAQWARAVKSIQWRRQRLKTEIKE